MHEARAAEKATRASAGFIEAIERINGKKPPPGVKQINDGLASQLRKSARHYSGVYWGTMQLVEEAAKQASNPSASVCPLYWDGLPNDPHFSRWDGEESRQSRGNHSQR